MPQVGAAKTLGFNVPQFIRADDQLRIIKMTIVTRPFVLDFAGAYLDAPPEFSDEIWEDGESGKREQFDHRSLEVKAVLAALEEWDKRRDGYLGGRVCVSVALASNHHS